MFGSFGCCFRASKDGAKDKFVARTVISVTLALLFLHKFTLLVVGRDAAAQAADLLIVCMQPKEVVSLLNPEATF